MTDIVNANILFIGASYANFLESLTNKLYFKYVIKSIYLGMYALGFYYLGASTGVSFFFLYLLNIFIQSIKIYKYMIMKILFTVLIILSFIFFKEFKIIDILMYLLFLSFIWVRPYIKKDKNISRFKLIKKLIISIYSYIVCAYVPAVLNIMSVAFYFISGSLIKLTNFTNSRT